MQLLLVHENPGRALQLGEICVTCLFLIYSTCVILVVAKSGWKTSVLPLSENCSDICFGLAYIERVLPIENMSLDFEEVDSGLLYDSYSIYVHFLHQCYFL